MTHGTPLTWKREGDRLCCTLSLDASHRTLLQDHIQHRLREARARRFGVLHPSTVSLERDLLVARFPHGALDGEAADPADLDTNGRMWMDRVLLPCLELLLHCHQSGIMGFQRPPIRSRWVLPPSWFVPQPKGPELAELTRQDLDLAVTWVGAQRARLAGLLPREFTAKLSALLRVLEEGDPERLRDALDSETQSAALEARLRPAPADLLTFLTEAELLERVASSYPYRLLETDEAARLGLHPGDLQIVELSPRQKDPHFPKLNRPSPQEVWDELTDASPTTPTLVASRDLPNPLSSRFDEGEVRVRWVGVHGDQPYLYVTPYTEPIPKHGWLRLHLAGDNVVMERKRHFSRFAGAHPALLPLLQNLPPARPFKENPQPRETLEEVILKTEGFFAVQGPPGTGKTYLATQVVRRFLTENPGGRVLVCAKEHFALDHILTTITSGLETDHIPFRAFRSISLAKQRSGYEGADARWLGRAVTADLAGRAWRAEAQGWEAHQAATSDHHDERLRSLAEASANLYFCTTMDAALVSFLERVSFDLVIVEEAGKCYPSELLHAACLGRTTLMIGDHKQLPPYQERRTRDAVAAWVSSLTEASKNNHLRQGMEARFGGMVGSLTGLLEHKRGSINDNDLSWLRPFEMLFERLASRHRLDEQFRMEAPLSRLIGSVFYERPFSHRKGELLAAGRLQPRPLAESLPGELDVPLLWIDTPHMTLHPEATEDPQKRGVRDNPYELDCVIAYLKRLLPGHDLDLVVLTPYNAQKSLLLQSERLREICASLTSKRIEQVVRTTDEYQGREAELTVVSLVRNNSLGSRAWGFMTELERLNVMFSRARFRQVVVGCGAHIDRHAKEVPWLKAVWDAYQREAQDAQAGLILGAEAFSHG